jgi:hypothetical protein
MNKNTIIIILTAVIFTIVVIVGLVLLSLIQEQYIKTLPDSSKRCLYNTNTQKLDNICVDSSECDSSLNLTCNGGKCVCKDGYRVVNGNCVAFAHGDTCNPDVNKCGGDLECR